MAKSIEMTPEQTKLFNELKKLSKRANQRLVRLERAFGKETWASKNLRNKLDIEPLQAWTETSRVRINKSMTITQLEATIKATKEFLNSETSKVKGVKDVRKRQIKEIQKTIDIDDSEEDFSFKMAENLSDIFETEYNWILKYIRYEEVFGIISDSIEAKDNENDFLNRLENYITLSTDIDLTSKAREMYQHFVENYI